MPRYLLDTNAVIRLLSPTPNMVQQRVQSHPPMEIGISSVVMFELYYGAYRSQRINRNLGILNAIQLPKILFDTDDALAAGKIRGELAEMGLPIGPYDLLIAGQALARGLCLITANTREFQRVTNLHIEDWEM